MNYETLIYEKIDGVAVITLNRPEKKNALNVKLMTEIRLAAAEAENDDTVAVMLMTGGTKAFAAGADLSEITPDGMPPGGTLIWEVSAALISMTKPTIAAISGPCVAGGLALAISCDFRIASETARIGDGHAKVGVLGDTVRLPRMIGASFAKELIFTGDLVSGIEAARIGLVNHVYPEDKFMEEAMNLARKMAKFGLTFLKINKKAMNWGMTMTPGDAQLWAAICNKELRDTGLFKKNQQAFFNKEWKGNTPK
jgi:enoyl-CoA hydratase/carnithine racemase